MYSMTAVYWRAFRRVERRKVAYLASPSDAAYVLLADACRLANRLAMCLR